MVRGRSEKRVGMASPDALLFVVETVGAYLCGDLS